MRCAKADPGEASIHVVGCPSQPISSANRSRAREENSRRATHCCDAAREVRQNSPSASSCRRGCKTSRIVRSEGHDHPARGEALQVGRSPVTTVARCRLATSTTEASITSAVRVTPQSSPAARDSRRSSGSDAHLSASQEPRQRDLAASIAPCSSDYECRAELASCRATSCAK